MRPLTIPVARTCIFEKSGSPVGQVTAAPRSTSIFVVGASSQSRPSVPPSPNFLRPYPVSPFLVAFQFHCEAKKQAVPVRAHSRASGCLAGWHSSFGTLLVIYQRNSLRFILKSELPSGRGIAVTPALYCSPRIVLIYTDTRLYSCLCSDSDLIWRSRRVFGSSRYNQLQHCDHRYDRLACEPTDAMSATQRLIMLPFENNQTHGSSDSFFLISN